MKGLKLCEILAELDSGLPQDMEFNGLPFEEVRGDPDQWTM